MADAPVATESLADQAYARIKTAIVSCALAPGERITERVLAERFGMGLSPIRNALLRLNNEGLVSTLPRSGYRVAPLTIDDVESLFDAWRVLGSAIIERAARACTDRDLELIAKELEALQREQRRRRTERLEAVVEVAQTIWKHYCRLAGNPRLTEMWQRLDPDLTRVFVIAWQDPNVAQGFMGTFGDDALHLSDPATSVQEFVAIIARVERHVLDTLQRSESLRSHEIVLGDGLG